MLSCRPITLNLSLCRRTIALGGILCLGGLVAPGMPQAQAVPVLNAAGDYFENTGTERQRAQAGPEKWQITDSTGLNCRIAEKFYGMDLAASNQTMGELFRDNVHEVGQWPVVTVLAFKQQVPAIRGRLMGLRQRQVIDRQGKPWIAVRSPKGDCFLRANRQYVMPADEAVGSVPTSKPTPTSKPASLLKPGQYYAQGSMYARSGRQVYGQGDRICLRFVDGPPTPYQGEQKITISSFGARGSQLYSPTLQLTLDVSPGGIAFKESGSRALWELAPAASPLSLPAPEQQALNRCLASDRPFNQVLKGAFIPGIPFPSPG